MHCTAWRRRRRAHGRRSPCGRRGGRARRHLTWRPSDADAARLVIAPPHPLYGGSMDSPVVERDRVGERPRGPRVAALQLARRRRERAACASGDPRDADADYAAALAHARGARCRARCSRAATRSAPRPRCAAAPAAPAHRPRAARGAAAGAARARGAPRRSSRPTADPDRRRRPARPCGGRSQSRSRTRRGARLEIIPRRDHFCHAQRPPRLDGRAAAAMRSARRSQRAARRARRQRSQLPPPGPIL